MFLRSLGGFRFQLFLIVFGNIKGLRKGLKGNGNGEKRKKKRKKRKITIHWCDCKKIE
jgi:hypothetical protein